MDIVSISFILIKCDDETKTRFRHIREKFVSYKIVTKAGLTHLTDGKVWSLNSFKLIVKSLLITFSHTYEINLAVF